MMKLELFNTDLNHLAQELGVALLDTLLPTEWYEPPNQWQITNFLKSEILSKLANYSETEQNRYLPLLAQIHKHRFALLDPATNEELFKAKEVESNLSSLELQCDSLLACESALDTSKILDLAKTFQLVNNLSSELSARLKDVTAQNICVLREALQVLEGQEITRETLDKTSPQTVKLLNSL